MTGPNKDQAMQFAIMLQAGMPTGDALMYFVPEGADPTTLAQMHSLWTRSGEVKKAIATLQRKPWAEMSLQERIDAALDIHYSALAYFLFSHNYSDLEGQERQKADTARAALEAKKAGLAGKNDVLSQFFSDVASGRVKLQRPTSGLGLEH